jgi:hypothetical protein
MNRLDELEAKLAAEVAAATPSRRLEAALLEEFEARRRRSHRPWWLLAAAACVAGVVAFWPKPAEPPKSVVQVVRRAAQAPVAPAGVAVTTPKRTRKRRPAKPVDPEPQFIRIPYSAPLAPYERAEIVRADIPVAALTAAGFNVATPDAGATAQADLLIGEDGMAHAVRLISIRSIPR